MTAKNLQSPFFPATDQTGSSIVEVLVALSLISVLFMHVFYSTMLSFISTTRAQHTAIATQIGAEALEDYATVNPETLTDSLDGEVEVVVDGITYTVSTDVTVNADRTRQVDITVSTVHTGGEISVDLSNSFALWGTR